MRMSLGPNTSDQATTNNNSNTTWFLVGTVTGVVVSQLLVVIVRRYKVTTTLKGVTTNTNNDNNWNNKNNESSPLSSLPAPRRFGAIIKLKPEYYVRYRELHDNVWPDVLQRMYQSNVRNFTIYYHKETNILFQHFEWIGHWSLQSSLLSNNNTNTTVDVEKQLFEKDMNDIATDPITIKWWRECEPCQEPFDSNAIPPSTKKNTNNNCENTKESSSPWWTSLECVSHCGYWPMTFSNLPNDPDFKPFK